MKLRDVRDRKDLVKVTDLKEQVIADFRANSGWVGGPYEGARIILVHDRGAKTGRERVTPMTYFPQVDGSMVVVASNRGADRNPAWYHNLMAHPRVVVEVGAETFEVDATEIVGAAREAVWAAIAAELPAVDDYRERASRTIPLVRLERAH
ncbi:nitroreductase/quinone reductase family protein [Pseudonocardia dioxanivorans]|uniref:nitroreductase/quinone reductase family protein n=1 Tax=Pseudonocardia dioxanivorans TaxID=240495 RepID=UPI001A9E200C|nr:nitroreductase/quinone reductase family protein [Pseudonocardia dioxanivorans]